jgi:hypothetical protein
MMRKKGKKHTHTHTYIYIYYRGNLSSYDCESEL